MGSCKLAASRVNEGSILSPSPWKKITRFSSTPSAEHWYWNLRSVHVREGSGFLYPDMSTALRFSGWLGSGSLGVFVVVLGAVVGFLVLPVLFALLALLVDVLAFEVDEGALAGTHASLCEGQSFR